MNHRSVLKRSPISPSAFFLVVVLAFPAFAAQFQQGDEIKLTRDEPLYFRDQIFRQAKSGETFSVLAHRADAKKVFVRGTDKGGKQIALSISETAVAAAPLAAAKLQAEAISAAKARRYADGLQLVERALRSDPAEPVLQQTFQAITQLQTAAQALDRAKADQRLVGVEAARKRKNADTADRPNPLNPRDTSGQERAKQMRADASQTETIAAAAVRSAQDAWESAIRTLTGLPTIPAPAKIPASDLAIAGEKGARLPSQETIIPDALPVTAPAIVPPMQAPSMDAAAKSDARNITNGDVAGAATGQQRESSIKERPIPASDEVGSPEASKVITSPEAAQPDRDSDKDVSPSSAPSQRGLNALAKGDYDLAISSFTEAIALEPENVAAHSNRGVAYRNKFAFTKAIADYDQALRLDRNYKPASDARKAAYIAKGLLVTIVLVAGLMSVALLGLLARRVRLFNRRSNTTSTLFKFECSHCGQRISTDDGQCGASSFCPTCGGEVTVPACGPEQTQPEYQTEEDFTNKHPTGAIPSTPTNFSFAATGFRRLFRWATESTKMRGRTNQAWEVCKQGVEKATVAARLAKKQAHREKLKMIDLKQADYLSGKRAYENQVASETHSAICAQIAEVDHEIDTLRTTPEPMGTSRMEKGKATANAAARLAKANALSLKRTGLLIKLGACLRQDPCDASGFVEIGFAREIAETIRRLNSDIETLASKSFSWAKHALLIVAGIAVFVLASASFQFFPHLSYPTTDAESIKQRSTKSFQVEQPYIPEAFRVVGQLSTYYNYDYGSAERTHFSISLSFPDGESLHGYVPRDSTDGQALYEVLKDGEYHRLILLLRYPHDSKNSGGGSVTEIFRFVQREWRQKDHFPVEDFVRIAHWYGFGYMQGAALRTMKRIVGGSNTASRDDVRDLLISSHVDPKRVSAEEFQSCYDGFVDGHFSRRARFPKQDDPPRNH